MQRLFSFMLCPSIYSVSCPSLSYDEALNEAGISTIISYCEDICDKVFNAALGNKHNKLNKLLTEANKTIFTKKSPTLSTSTVEDVPFQKYFYSVIVPKVQLNDSVLIDLFTDTVAILN